MRAVHLTWTAGVPEPEVARRATTRIASVHYVADVPRFPSRDHFAARNGTAPIEASSGNQAIRRLSRRGNRGLNHAIHMAAVSQIRHRHSYGRAYYDKRIAEGKTRKEAPRALKRQVSDAIHRRLQADARKAAAATGPGGQHLAARRTSRGHAVRLRDRRPCTCRTRPRPAVPVLVPVPEPVATAAPPGRECARRGLGPIPPPNRKDQTMKTP